MNAKEKNHYSPVGNFACGAGLIGVTVRNKLTHNPKKHLIEPNSNLPYTGSYGYMQSVCNNVTTFYPYPQGAYQYPMVTVRA